MRPELSDPIEQIALELYHAKRLSSRRFTVWQRVLHGETVPEIVATQTVTGSLRTLEREHKRAKEIIAQFIIEERQGQIRLGVTADTGHKPQWKPDKTQQGRGLQSAWPEEQLKLHHKKGRR